MYDLGNLPRSSMWVCVCVCLHPVVALCVCVCAFILYVYTYRTAAHTFKLFPYTMCCSCNRVYDCARSVGICNYVCVAPLCVRLIMFMNADLHPLHWMYGGLGPVLLYTIIEVTQQVQRDTYSMQCNAADPFTYILRNPHLSFVRLSILTNEWINDWYCQL